MPAERIINMHTHIFPVKIAEKAVGAIGDFYDIKMEIKGTPEYILEDGKNIGVEKYLVSSTATTAHQLYCSRASCSSRIYRLRFNSSGL